MPTLDRTVQINRRLGRNYFRSSGKRGENLPVNALLAISAEPPQYAATMYVVSIPEIVAELQALGVPETDFLARCGLHKRTWERLKAGEYSPRQDTARRIAATMTVLRAAHTGKPPSGGGGGEDGDSGVKCAMAEPCA
jgi:uncharacterized protein (DUF2384 family)